MNTLQKNNHNIKSFTKEFSIKNYHFEFSFRLDKDKGIKTFFFFIKKRYQRNQEMYISKIGYGLEHQLINDRNKIIARKRKQLLKQQ